MNKTQVSILRVNKVDLYLKQIVQDTVWITHVNAILNWLPNKGKDVNRLRYEIVVTLISVADFSSRHPGWKKQDNISQFPNIEC